MLRTILDFLKDLLQTGLRVLRFSTGTGLQTIGRPDRQSPVFVTCNFDLTVRRVRRALRGLDCYLLVAPTNGVNVWCAAAGGDFTADDVVSVVKTSRISELVDHRRLILPQLAATGVERGPVNERTGWRVVFGPVRASDIKAYVADHFRKTPEMRRVRFDPLERVEMAAMWALPTSIVFMIPMLIWWRPLALPALALIWGISVGTFMAFPLLDRILRGGKADGHGALGSNGWVQRLPFFNPGLIPSLAVFAVFLAALAVYVSFAGGLGWMSLLWWGVPGAVISAVMSFELTGSTPIYKSGGHEERMLTVQLLEDRCTGKAMCEQVCPKSCYEVDSKKHKAVIVSGHECVQCGACIVQCPDDALVFTFPDGGTIPPEEVRRYKLNLLGERKKSASA